MKTRKPVVLPLARDWAHSNGPAWKQGGMFG